MGKLTNAFQKTLTHDKILLYLLDHEEGRVSDMSVELKKSLSTIHEFCGHLEKDGLIDHAGTRRVLTQKGLEYIRRNYGDGVRDGVRDSIRSS